MTQLHPLTTILLAIVATLAITTNEPLVTMLFLLPLANQMVAGWAVAPDDDDGVIVNEQVEPYE